MKARAWRVYAWALWKLTDLMAARAVQCSDRAVRCENRAVAWRRAESRWWVRANRVESEAADATAEGWEPDDDV